MKRARGWGEGAVYRRKDGRWAASVSLGTEKDDSGKVRRVRREVYGKTKSDVMKKLDGLRLELMRGENITDKLTTGVWLERWLEESARVTVRETTYIQYKAQVQNHVTPALGRIPLRKLSPDHVAKFYSDLEKNGVSASIREAIHLRLHRALAVALKRGLVLRNVTDAVDRPKRRSNPMRALSVEQARNFLDIARGDRLYPLYVLAVTTGLRQGELFALRWSDVNLETGVVSVRGTLKIVKGRVYVDEPKTAKGRRRVDLGPDAVEVLRQHRATQAHGTEWVFTDGGGGPLRKPNVMARSFRPLLKAAGLPQIRFHDLRHTAATLLLAQGVHPKIVQERLGHASIDLTLDTYSHVLPGLQRQAAHGLDALLRQNTRAAD